MIPNSVTNIGRYAFSACESLSSIVIPNSVTNIGEGAFSDCECLSSVVIPNSVTSIGRYAFWGCTKLADMTCEAVAEPTTYVSAFQDSQTHNGTLRVPAESVDKYKAAEGWSEWGNIVAIGTPDTGEGQPDTDVSQYDNVVYVNNVEGRPGSQVTLSVQMDNVAPVYGYEFRLHLPKGVTVATETDAYGDINPMVTLTTSRTSATRHTFESSINAEGMLTVLCYSTKKYTFSGNSGEVAQIVLDIADDVEAGDYPIIIRGEAISLEGVTPEIEFIKSTLAISDFKVGDANGDTKVNVGDITTIAGYILGSSSGNFVFKGADANEDNKVNVGDITTIAGMILNGTANSAKSRNVKSVGSAQFSLADVAVIRGGEIVVPVYVKNSEAAFSSFQFDVNVPESFKVKGINANANRVALDYLQGAEIENGVCRVLGYSLRDRMVRGTEGAVVYLTLSAEDVMEGTYDFSISNGVFAQGNSTIESAEVKATITVADATAIFGIASANQLVIVYDVNGRAVKNGVKASDCLDGLSKGIYIVNGVKIVK